MAEAENIVQIAAADARAGHDGNQDSSEDPPGFLWRQNLRHGRGKHHCQVHACLGVGRNHCLQAR